MTNAPMPNVQKDEKCSGNGALLHGLTFDRDSSFQFEMFSPSIESHVRSWLHNEPDFVSLCRVSIIESFEVPCLEPIAS